MDLIRAQVCGQSNIGGGALHVNEPSFGCVIGWFDPDRYECQRVLRLRARLGPLYISAQRVSINTGRSGPVMEADSA